jgi:hypothetical protein
MLRDPLLGQRTRIVKFTPRRARGSERHASQPNVTRADADRKTWREEGDFLAYPAHLERWQRSHLERAGELAQRFAAARLPHDSGRTRAIG